MEKVLMLSEKSVVDDLSKMHTEKSVLESFMKSFAGRRKILVIRVSGEEEEILEEIEAFSRDTKRAYLHLDGQGLTPEIIREVSLRKDEPLLVAVSHLSQVRNLDTLEEAAVFRAIMNVADPGNLEDGFHSESAFVFLAGEDFPSQELASISLTWAYESVFLDLRDLRTKVMEHMKRYKEKVLRLDEGVENQGRKYDHILPEKHYELNFSLEVSENRIRDRYLSSIHWSRFSNHLNSSQVMAVNFFYPLIRHQELDGFLALAGIEDEVIYDEDHIVFNKMSEKEKTDCRKTCFDLYLKLKSGNEVYIQANYTNGCYGRAVDERYAARYREIYEPMIRDSRIIREEFKTEAHFLEHYRFMRSLAHLDEESHLIVIYPRENWPIREKSLTLREEILKPRFRGNFIPMTWEELLEMITGNVRENNLARFYDAWFKDKYFRY